MSLVDPTNREIALNLHRPMIYEECGVTHVTSASLIVDADQDSSFVPGAWVYIQVTDEDHDAAPIKLTYPEAELLWQRLGLILGKTE